MNNWIFLSMKLRLHKYNPFCWSQQAAESFKCVVYFRNYWGSAMAVQSVVSPVLLSSHRFHFIIFIRHSHFVVKVVNYFTNLTSPILLLYSPNQKSFIPTTGLSWSASRLRKFQNLGRFQRRARPRTTTHGRLGVFGGTRWLSTTHQNHRRRRKSSSHLKWVHQWIWHTILRLRAFWPSNNKRLRHFLARRRSPINWIFIEVNLVLRGWVRPPFY